MESSITISFESGVRLCCYICGEGLLVEKSDGFGKGLVFSVKPCCKCLKNLNEIKQIYDNMNKLFQQY